MLNFSNFKLNANIKNHSFVTRELIHALFHSKRKMKILFSTKPNWESSIKNGFLLTHHQITFGNFLLETLADYDLVVPLTIEDLKYLNTKRDLIAKNPIPIPSLQNILLCDDKYLFNNTLIANNFGDYIPKMGTQSVYPYILKKRIDAWGKNTFIITNAYIEQEFAHLLRDPDYFTQELIPGQCEYATHIVFKENKIACSINIEHAFSSNTPIKGKDQRIYTKICHCPFLDLFSSILTLIGFEGLCCINYKVSRNIPHILEINPRFGGSLRPYFFSFIRQL